MTAPAAKLILVDHNGLLLV
jgi:hypothetical protein